MTDITVSMQMSENCYGVTLCCLYTRLHTYTYPYTYTYSDTHTYPYTYSDTHSRTYIYIYIYVYICIYIYTYSDTYAYTYAYAHTYVYIYIFLCVCTCILHLNSHTNMFIFFYTCIAQLTSVKYEQLGMSQKSEALRASSSHSVSSVSKLNENILLFRVAFRDTTSFPSSIHLTESRSPRLRVRNLRPSSDQRPL